MPARPGMNPFDPGFRADSHAAYGRMRAAAPFTQVTVDDGRMFWLVTGYEEAVRVLKDHDRFGNDVRNALTPDELERFLRSAGRDLTGEQRKRMFEVGAILDGHLLTSDPPKHSSLRRLVSQSFTPRFVEALRPRVQELADQLLDAALARAQEGGCRELDLIEEFASPLPLAVMEEILGLPMTEREQFRHWSNAVVAQEPTGRWNAEMVARMAGFSDYLCALCREKRRMPAADLVSQLIRAEADGDSLDENELVAMVFLLIVAGQETTVNLIGNGMLMLFEHPDQRALLVQNPELLRGAVEEILRYQGAAEMSVVRWAREDVEIGEGRTIRRGEPVVVIVAAADRDPAQFPQPDRFDVTRQPTRHLAFGTGVHACLGAPLARLETQVALATLLRRVPSIRLAVPPAELRWRPGSLLRGLIALPVAF